MNGQGEGGQGSSGERGKLVRGKNTQVKRVNTNVAKQKIVIIKG